MPTVTNRNIRLRTILAASVFLAGASFFPALAQDAAVARPNLVLKETVEGLPKLDKVEISVLTATIAPGAKTPFHTHRHPVSVYILQGAFTLEMEGRQPVTLKAGQAMVEPPNVKMTGYNRSATEETKVVVFYVAEPGTPFLDPVR